MVYLIWFFFTIQHVTTMANMETCRDVKIENATSVTCLEIVKK